MQGQHVGFSKGPEDHWRGLPDLEVCSTRQSSHWTMPWDIARREEEREAMSRESPARVRANVSKDRPRRQPPREGAGGDLSQNGLSQNGYGATRVFGKWVQ